MANIVRNMVSLIGISDNIPLSSELYKEFSVNDTTCIPCQKPSMERLLSSAFDAEVVSIRLINTPARISGKTLAPSAEGETLTGRKLVVEIKFSQKVQYVADEPRQSIHAFHNEFIVSEFVIVPSRFIIGGQCLTSDYLFANNMFVVTPYIEDANVRVINNRCICTNITVFLQVDIKQCIFDSGTPLYPVNNITTISSLCSAQAATDNLPPQDLTEDIKGGIL